MEQFSEMRFPLAGLDVAHSLDEQPPDTTRQGVNVRACEVITRRLRGGQRPGIDKYLPVPAASGVLQHIAVIVDPQAPAVGSDDGNGELPGLNTPGQNSNVGVPYPGGYQPVRHKGIGISLSGPASAPADGTPVLLRALVKARGFPAPRQRVSVRTSPAGRVGDGTAAVTGPSGIALFSVSDTNSETVTYTASCGAANASAAVKYSKVTPYVIFIYGFSQSGSPFGTIDYNVSLNGTPIVTAGHGGFTGPYQHDGTMFATDASVPESLFPLDAAPDGTTFGFPPGTGPPTFPVQQLPAGLLNAPGDNTLDYTVAINPPDASAALALWVWGATKTGNNWSSPVEITGTAGVISGSFLFTL